MKKVTAVIGTQTKKGTYRAIQEFEKNLVAKGGVEFEYVFLHDYNLEFCRGCKVCFNNGEELCPLKDDRDTLIAKMEESDGIIFATPNYAFGMSARLKNLLDRTAFIMHRPRFFQKAFTSVVVQGVYGGNAIVKNLNFAAENLGFSTSKGCCVNTLEPFTPEREKKLIKAIGKTADRFYKTLMKPSASPSVYRLALFRVSRTNIGKLDEEYLDYRYFREKGWFESGYYYPTSLGFAKKIAGNLFDWLGNSFLKVG